MLLIEQCACAIAHDILFLGLREVAATPKCITALFIHNRSDTFPVVIVTSVGCSPSSLCGS